VALLRFHTFTKTLINFDVNHHEFEAQSDVNHDNLAIEAQLGGKITGIRVRVQQVRNLNDQFVS
jgi:hypothetical protein